MFEYASYIYINFKKIKNLIYNVVSFCKKKM